MQQRHARYALDMIASSAVGRVAFTDIPLALRERARDLLCAATGVRIEERGNMPCALDETGPIQASSTQVRTSAVLLAAANIDAWCRQPHEDLTEFLPRKWPSGADEIIKAMGFDAASVLSFGRVVHVVEISDGNRRATLHLPQSELPDFTYRHGPVAWRNGTLSIRKFGIPRLLGTALINQSIGHVVDDEAIAENIIRHVQAGPARDETLRITTQHAKKWRTELPSAAMHK